MVHDQRSALSTYMAGLLSAGRVVFTSAEAEEALDIGRGAFLDAAERLQRRKHLLNLRQGFYVIVPPQFATWEAPPPNWYIDALMRHEDQAYYVGLLKAGRIARRGTPGRDGISGHYRQTPPKNQGGTQPYRFLLP